MDVHCCNCGEPWDQYHLRHELADMTPGELTADGWRFGTSRLVVLHCPCCPKDGVALPDAEDRKQATQQIAELLGDDEDDLASALEDFGL
jgi:hypothetical protein